MDALEQYKVLCAEVRLILHPYGFKRSGGSYYRDVGEIVHVIGIQKSDTSTTQAFKFRLNSGIWSRIVGEFLVRNRGQVPKSTGNCHSYSSVRSLRDPRRDWWHVESPDDLARAIEGIRQLLVHEEIPRLNSLFTTNDVLIEWQNRFPDWIEIITAHREGREPKL